MTLYRKRPAVVDAMQWTGTNIVDLWAWGGAEGIYGPTDENPAGLLLTTIDDVQVPCPLGHWVIMEPVPARFYPCQPDVFADSYEPVQTDPVVE